MDVDGLAPSAPEGKTFRASIWSWPMVLAATKACAQRAGLAISFAGWDYNAGCGLRDPATCRALADAIDAALLGRGDDERLESPMVRASSFTHMVVGALGARMADGKTVDESVGVEVRHLRRWVAFLRACGGFEIW